MNVKVPHMTTDAQAEAFLDQDLSDLDFTQFKPVRFELRHKDAGVNTHLSKA
jgi:predicted DNA binding CopG/RHH family protein